jgi:UDP-2,3-diacylglucosamine pyrophosphatase LpxH
VARSDLYIISDLHLCDGTAVEDFQPDDERALVSLLFALGRSRTATLIINGDFIDFVQVQPRPGMWRGPTLDACEAESLEKLERVLRAHSPVFDALGRFVALGNTLRVHVGNHDIDLLWPGVQARLRERLGLTPGHPALSFGEAFLEAGLYVEHGHQADPVNSFPTQPAILHPDPQGVLRLERCWGTRFVEEFYNKIEMLDGCAMLDNVRPRMQAALIIIKHAILDRQMHATLYAGVQVIVETLALLTTEQDLSNAAAQLGVSRQVLSWLVSVAGWLGLGAASAAGAYMAKGGGLRLTVPSLQTAYSFGMQMRDGTQLAHFAPTSDRINGRQAKSAAADDASAPEQPAARRDDVAPAQQPYLQRAASIAARHADVRAVCFGHTHQAITAARAVDAEPGWPLPQTTARYFNSGAWVRTLNIAELSPAQLTFAYLAQPDHYRKGRDYLRVCWPNHPQIPVVETLRWGEAR